MKKFIKSLKSIKKEVMTIALRKKIYKEDNDTICYIMENSWNLRQCNLLVDHIFLILR